LETAVLSSHWTKITKNNARLTSIFQDNPNKPVPEWFLGFYRSKDGGDNDDSWNYKTSKGAVKSSPPAKQYPAVYEPNGLSVAEPVSKRALK